MSNNRKLTPMKFYAYSIMVRPGVMNPLHHARRLFQQFLVDQAAKIESERLSYIRTHQKELRCERLRGLRDALHSEDGNPASVGQRIVLSSTFVGGPRYLLERQQDAMAYVHKFGKPDLFLTMTCNPSWQEITDELLPGQSAADRPDLTTRVFDLKRKIFLKRIRSMFGTQVAHVCALEFQKRGLPHIHVLLWLAPADKIRPDRYDDVISAEIPSEQEDPELRQLVLQHMVHGPCGSGLAPDAACLQDGRCRKNFPKEFQRATLTTDNGYSLYRRR